MVLLAIWHAKRRRLACSFYEPGSPSHRKDPTKIKPLVFVIAATWEDDMKTRAWFIGLLLFLACSACAAVRWRPRGALQEC